MEKELQNEEYKDNQIIEEDTGLLDAADAAAEQRGKDFQRKGPQINFTSTLVDSSMKE